MSAEDVAPENQGGREENCGESPLVSVIIPAYNYARYLPEAVDSALAQTYRRVEVVIVDDESTDETPELVKNRYGDCDRVRYQWQKNAGLAASRNTGIRMAQGELLVFLDADDILDPHMVERSWEVLREKGEDFALVAHQMGVIDRDGTRQPERFRFPRTDVEITTLDLLVMSRFGCAVLARKSAFEACGLFDSSLAASEDREMWIRISMTYRLFRLGESLSCLRRHGENMSGSGTRQAAAIRVVLEKARRAGVLAGWKKFYWAKVYAMAFYQDGLMQSRRSKWGAIRKILASVLLWPWYTRSHDLGQCRFFRLRSLLRLIRRRPG